MLDKKIFDQWKFLINIDNVCIKKFLPVTPKKNLIKKNFIKISTKYSFLTPNFFWPTIKNIFWPKLFWNKIDQIHFLLKNFVWPKLFYPKFFSKKMLASHFIDQHFFNQKFSDQNEKSFLTKRFLFLKTIIIPNKWVLTQLKSSYQSISGEILSHLDDNIS